MTTIVGRDNDVSKGPTSFWTSQSIVCIDAQSCETAASSAWRRETRSIKTSYNEGKFILISLVNQSQLIMIFVAVVGQVDDASSAQSSATYNALVCFIVGISNLSILCFIFAPKLIVYYDPVVAGRRFSLTQIRKTEPVESPKSKI